MKALSPALQSVYARRRNAFTLLEIIVATGLSLILMAAMLSAANLYRQVSETGRSGVERALVLRALIRLMEQDIRACIPPIEEEEETTTSSSTSEQASQIESIDTAEALSGLNGGLVGDTGTVIFNTSRPMRHAGWLPQTSATDRSIQHGDLRSVAYFVSQPGSPGLAGLIPRKDGSDGIGLARLEGERTAIAYADAMGDVEGLTGFVQPLAEEVQQIQFRYFDGLYWYDQWDSDLYGQLPNAIEVILSLRTLDTATQEGLATSQDSGTVYRHVIVLPTAQPYVATQ